MKRMILGCIMILAIQLNAQVFHKDSLAMPKLENEVGMQEVIQIDSVSKTELYKRAKLWVVESFKSAKNVIQLDDVENSTIVIKGITTIYFKAFIATADLDVKFTLKIEAKEGRYRYTLNNVNFILAGNNDTPASNYWKNPNLTKNTRVALGEELANIIIRLKKGMLKATSADKW